jgi:hypothetical protein
MTRFTSSSKLLSVAVLATSLACAFSADEAQAQTRAFVAAQGSDGNPCSFALPCRTFQRAHNVVAAGGEINVLDPAGYGPLVITKAISIQGHDFSGISSPIGGTAIIINAGAADIVNLRGLIIEGAGGFVGSNGIIFNSGRSLVVENCVVRNHAGDGVEFLATGASNLVMSNTVVADNGGNGIYIQPIGSAHVTATLSRVGVHNNNSHGIGISGGFSSGYIDVAVADSVVSNNGLAGMIVDASGAAIIWSVFFRSVSSYNGTGIASSGDPFTGIFVSQSLLFRNQIGYSGFNASYGDNVSANYSSDDPHFTRGKN